MKLLSLLISVIFMLGTSSANAASFSLETQISESFRPQHDSLSLVIRSNDVSLTRAHIKLLAPMSSLLVSTDFPIVEGSILHDGDVILENGQFTFAFVPPIRGQYVLQITGENQAPEEHSFSIPENPAKVRNLLVFFMILGLICVASGFALARTRSRGELPLRFAASVILLSLALIPRSLSAHGDEDHEPVQSAKDATTVNETGLNLDLHRITDHVRVGEPAELSASMTDANGLAVPAEFHLTFRQLEHDVEVFSVRIRQEDGNFHWKGQFYDGSTHRVALEVTPIASDTTPLKASLDVEVEAISPPFPAVAKSFGAMMMFAALLMSLGFLLGGWNSRRVPS